MSSDSKGHSFKVYAVIRKAVLFPVLKNYPHLLSNQGRSLRVRRGRLRTLVLSEGYTPACGLVIQNVQHQTDRFLDVPHSLDAVVSLADTSGQSGAARGEASILFLFQNNRECSSISSHLRSTLADSPSEFGEQKAPGTDPGASNVSIFGSGGWIRTNDLRVMSPTSCHCSTPRREPERTRSWSCESVSLKLLAWVKSLDRLVPVC